MSALKDTFKRYPNPVFIETGCYHGDGIQMALDAGFEMVYSIELDPKNLVICEERFKDNPHVELIFGDSYEMLGELIKVIKEPITFWLDAHSDKYLENWIGKYKSPLIQELDAIKRHYTKGDKILIDDLRSWDMDYYGFTTDVLKEKILEIDKDYKILFENGTALNDILVAI
jgi:hypothetical protein